MVMLAPFSKKPLHLTLRGITSNDQDLSVRLHTLDAVVSRVPNDSSRLTSFELSPYHTCNFLEYQKD